MVNMTSVAAPRERLVIREPLRLIRGEQNGPLLDLGPCIARLSRTRESTQKEKRRHKRELDPWKGY